MTQPLQNLRILILEDSDDDARLSALALERHGVGVEWERVENEPELLGVLDRNTPDVILSDHGMPRLDSARALKLLNDHDKRIPFILVSGTIGEEAVIELFHRDANDFVAKSHLERLGPSVERALKETRAEQKHQAASRALREGERRYRCLVTATSDFLWWADSEGSIYELDPSWLDYTGYTLQQSLGFGSFEAIHPEDRAEYLAAWREAIRTGNVFRREYRLRRHDGAYGWFLDRMAPILDDASSIVEWVGTSADISQRKEAEQALRASEARYRTLFEDSPNGVMIMDGIEVLDCNARAPDIFGRHRDELIGLSVQAFSPMLQPNGDPSGVMAQRLTEAARTHGPQEFEWIILRGDGDRATIEVLLASVDHHLHAVVWDVTEQRAAEAEMRKLSRAVQQAAEGVIITDANRVIEYVNPAFERITGYSADEIIGRTPSFLGSDHNEPGVRERLCDDLDAGREFHGMVVNRRRSGDLYYADMSIAPIRDDQGRLTHFIGTQYDVTVQLQKEHELARLAHFDPVTNLPNRTLIIDRLNHMLTQVPVVPGRLMVMHVDLDGFGLVNESWGHTGGDHVLETVARRLSDAAGPTATVGRIGNDGFVVAAMTTPSEESADTSVTRIQQALSEPTAFDGSELRVTAAIGIAFGPEDGDAAEALMAHAEMAMQRARERGREQMAFYTPAMHEEARQWLSIEGDLRRALQQNEFHLEYQPQVDLDTGRISGLEALLRWVHPARGPVPPGEFIPQLERSGLIVAVGEWVLHEACHRIAEWHAVLIGDRSDAIRVAVNLSLVQFEQRDLVEVVRHALEASGAEPRCLELELTETSLARHPEDATRTLHALRDLGVTVALDDFGTGYSSLNYLKHFPIDSVKIDRVFTDGVTRDPGDAAILRAVLALAESRHMKTVAEGVETEDQVRFLRAEGCRNVQGFYFAAAIAADDIPHMLVDSLRFDVSTKSSDTPP